MELDTNRSEVSRVLNRREPHPASEELYCELCQLISKMKKLGYVPDIDCIHQNMDKIEKEKMLWRHTEKLAITHGLMKGEKRGCL